MSDRSFNVLFVCAENSNRSILAEAVLRHWGRDRFRAFSAGFNPSGEVDKLAIDTLKAANLPTDELRSKSWQEFAAPGAPPMDFVISLCDTPAAKLEGTLPGHPLLAHWTITDPAAARESAPKQRNALRHALQELENRVRLFVLLRHEKPRPLPSAQAAAV
jgi:arsenate reductase (thioredoxin)